MSSAKKNIRGNLNFRNCLAYIERQKPQTILGEHHKAPIQAVKEFQMGVFC
jgi:hypothetical protein